MKPKKEWTKWFEDRSEPQPPHLLDHFIEAIRDEMREECKKAVRNRPFILDTSDLYNGIFEAIENAGKEEDNEDRS